MVHLLLMSTAAATPRAIAVSETLRRREAAQNALTDLRLEGLAPSADARRDVEQFVRGELTEGQLIGTIRTR
jgi:antitoxin VbhA-like protein